jgi:hypothetical protein
MADLIQLPPKEAKPNERLDFPCPWPPALQCNDAHGWRRKKGDTTWESWGEFKCFEGQVMENPAHFTPVAPTEPGAWEFKYELTHNGTVVLTFQVTITVPEPPKPGISRDTQKGIGATILILVTGGTGALIGGLFLGPVGAGIGFCGGCVVGIVEIAVIWFFSK